MTKSLVRWDCPNELHPGVLAPSRPRKDDVRRYCLDCSKKTGRLTERVAPKLAKQREAAEQKTRERAKKRAEKKRATMTQAETPQHFKCGEKAQGLCPWRLGGGSRGPIVEVRPSEAPRAPKREGRFVIVYDHGGDKYEAKAQIVTALMMLHYKCGDDVAGKNRLRLTVERFLKVRPKLDEPIDKAWIEIANLTRAKDAVEHLGDKIDRSSRATAAARRRRAAGKGAASRRQREARA